jgi:hypothetical protein
MYISDNMIGAKEDFEIINKIKKEVLRTKWEEGKKIQIHSKPKKEERIVVKRRVQKKLFGLFSVEVEEVAEVDVKKSEIIKVEKPWWSFLVW